MSDLDVIAWARGIVATCPDGTEMATKLSRLADLAEKAVEEWCDASTHPKDDRDVLLLVGSKRCIGYFSHIGFIWCINGLEVQPTHWRPLPAPPGGER